MIPSIITPTLQLTSIDGIWSTNSFQIMYPPRKFFLYDIRLTCLNPTQRQFQQSTPIFESCVVIRVDLRMDTKKIYIQKVIGLHDIWILNMITNLTFNIIWGISILSFNEHNESDIHMSFTNCEESGYPRFGFANHLMLIVSFMSQEKQPSGKSNHLRPINVTS